MSTLITSESEVYKHPDESILYSFDFTDMLRTEEIVSAVSSVVGTPDDLTISEETVISSETEVEDITIAANKGAKARIEGGNHGEDYEIEVTFTTNLGNTRVAVGILKVRSC